MQLIADLSTVALAILAGFQAGCITSWRDYKRQRNDQDTARRQYEARIGLLEHDLDRERAEHRQVEPHMRRAALDGVAASNRQDFQLIHPTQGLNLS